MSSAGVGPLCFLRSKVNTAVYQEVVEHFMLPAADQLYGDADFIFQQDLAPAHSANASILHILLEYSKQKWSPLNKLSLVKEITITNNNSTFSDSVANYKLSLNNLLEEQGKTAFPRTRGRIHETFLRRNFFLTAIFFLIF